MLWTFRIILHIMCVLYIFLLIIVDWSSETPLSFQKDTLDTILAENLRNKIGDIVIISL